MRFREIHVDYASAHIQHIQKALTLMNLQLPHVVRDITGVTGMKIIRATAGGQRDAAVLTSMRDVRCKASTATVQAALVGNQGKLAPNRFVQQAMRPAAHSRWLYAPFDRAARLLGLIKVLQQFRAPVGHGVQK